MIKGPISCPNCRRKIDYWRPNCQCGHFVGYPNRRAAEAEREKLAARYEKARQDAIQRGVASTLLTDLERLAEGGQPVIDMRAAVCDNLLRGGKYRNYDQRVESGERAPAAAQDHGDREMVGERLFPMYSQHIIFAALSPNGRGTTTYGGEVWMTWGTPFLVERWMSLIEENSYTFFEQHELGRLGAEVPWGYRAVWEDRAKLAVAKLGPLLTSATVPNDLNGLLLQASPTRAEDRFIEVHIYAEGGLDAREVDHVAFQHVPATLDEMQLWAQIQDNCAKLRIRVG